MSTLRENGQIVDPGESENAPAAGSPPPKLDCFVIMPISEQPGYAAGHFKEVYEDIIGPAIHDAGFSPVRADEVHASNLIHLDILGKLLDAPMAVCDLSAVNPNVMFELGIRQAFDKPVVLLEDQTTRDVFDIGPIRHVSYDGTLPYRGVKGARTLLTDAIVATAAMKPDEGTNSIVSLLGLRAAAMSSTVQDPQTARFSILERALADIAMELRDMRSSAFRLLTPTLHDSEADDDNNKFVTVSLLNGTAVNLTPELHKRVWLKARDLSRFSEPERRVQLRKMLGRQKEFVRAILVNEFDKDDARVEGAP